MINQQRLFTKDVRKGDIVRIFCKLGKGSTDARLTIWYCEKGYNLAPFVNINPKAMAIGEPQMFSPEAAHLMPEQPKREFEFTAPFNGTFEARQELEPDTVLAKARIKRYGKTNQKIRRFFRNLFRFGRSKDGARV